MKINSSNRQKSFRNFMSGLAYNLKSLDRYGTPIQLNINGETEIKSFPGSILTLLLYVVLAAYSVQKF